MSENKFLNCTLYNRSKHDENNNYTCLSNEIVNDNRLSAIEKGLMFMILSKSDSYVFNSTVLYKESKLSRTNYFSGIDNLILFGYIQKNKIANGWNWVINEKSIEISEAEKAKISTKISTKEQKKKDYNLSKISTGVNVDGVNVDGVNVDGVNADGVNADGVNADGVNADGVNADGVNVDGVNYTSGYILSNKETSIEEVNNKEKNNKEKITEEIITEEKNNKEVSTKQNPNIGENFSVSVFDLLSASAKDFLFNFFKVEFNLNLDNTSIENLTLYFEYYIGFLIFKLKTEKQIEVDNINEINSIITLPEFSFSYNEFNKFCGLLDNPNFTTIIKLNIENYKSKFSK